MKIKEILSEGVAGPKSCWPGYRKTGTQPGTGKNKGKRVNDCEKIGEAGSPAQQAAIAINMKKHNKKPKNESLDQEFDMIENIIDQIAEHNSVDADRKSVV